MGTHANDATSGDSVRLHGPTNRVCTAIQNALVNLLDAVGVTFSAVVGHLSGEIAAAHGASMLNVRDAILSPTIEERWPVLQHVLLGKKVQ